MRKANQITEGAIVLALFAVLFLVSYSFIPLLNIVLPLPFLLYTTRHGFKAGSLVFIVGLVLTILFGTVLSLPVTIMFGGAGLVMGHFYKKKAPRFHIFMAGLAVYLITTIASYGTSILLFQIDPLAASFVAMDEAIEMTKKILESTGQSSNSQMLEMFSQAKDYVRSLLPTLFVMVAALFSWITQALGGALLKRFKLDVELWPRFSQFSLPRSFIFYLLGITLLTRVEMEVGSTLFTIVMNLYFILMIAFVLQGISFIFYFVEKKGFPKGFAIFSVVLIFLIPILLYLVQFLGIIDLGFNLRKRTA